MLVSGLLRPTAARATESLHGVFGSAKCGARRHNKSCNNDVLHNPRVVVDGLLPRSKREAIDSLSQVLYLGKCIYKSIWNHNGFAQWCVDHGDTASLREMSLRGPVSAQNSYIATQFVSLPVKIDSIQELKREFDLYVNDPRSQFEVVENDQVSQPDAVCLPLSGSVGAGTTSDWHGGEESPVTNSPDPRIPVAADGQPGKLSSEAAGAKSDGLTTVVGRADVSSDHSCRHSEQAVTNPHSSALSSLLQTDTAAGVLPPAPRLHHSSPATVGGAS